MFSDEQECVNILAGGSSLSARRWASENIFLFLSPLLVIHVPAFRYRVVKAAFFGVLSVAVLTQVLIFTFISCALSGA